MELEPHSPRKHEVYYGWVIVGVVALASFSQTAETFPVWSVLLKPMTEEFGWSRSEFTGAMTIGTVIGAITAVGFGPMLDRYGPRWSVAAALGVVGASLLLMPLISTLWHFYALLVLGRVMHIGLIGIALSVITPKWFIAKRGRAVAFTRLGNRLGSTVTPLYAQILISVTELASCGGDCGRSCVAGIHGPGGHLPPKAARGHGAPSRRSHPGRDGSVPAAGPCNK